MLRALIGILLFFHASSAQITIQGTVTSTGAPVPDAFVRVFTVTIAGADTVRALMGTAQTDKAGLFSYRLSTAVHRDEPTLPDEFALTDNYPNPFEEKTQIGMDVGKQDQFTVTVYNILGQRMARLQQTLSAGSYAIRWQGAAIPGVYFATVQAGGRTKILKMLQLKRNGGVSALQIMNGPGGLLAKRSVAVHAAVAQYVKVVVTKETYETYVSALLPYASQSVTAPLTYMGAELVPSVQRMAALNAAQVKFDGFASLTPAEASVQIAAYLMTQPEFSESGVSEDGSAWGRFKDGRLAIFVNNRGQVPSGLHKQTSLTPPSDLPAGTNFRLADNLGSDFGYPYADVNSWLAEEGYPTTPPGNFLEMTSMGTVGMFVVNSHGGYGKTSDGSKVYAIWGAPQDTCGFDWWYRYELDANRLCYMYASTGNTTGKKNEWRYAFTARYVMEYMNFSQGSFVFLDACSSDNSIMKAAFLAKGASLYAGWSAPVLSTFAEKSSKYLFDGMLGGNHYDAENPKQRPFDWQSLYEWMHEHGHDMGNALGTCYLKLTPNPADENGFGLLVPSIQFVYAHEYEKKLYLWGLFGEDPGSEGSVTVNGTKLAVQEWKRDANTQMDRIICTMELEGAGSSGDVKVTVRKHESNVRQLSLYKGDIKYIHESGDGRQLTITHHVQFRVDLQSVRTKPREQPGYAPVNPQRIYAIDVSKADFEAGGVTLLADGAQVSWEGNTSLVNGINGEETSNRQFIAQIKFDPENKTARLALSGVVKDAITQTVRDKNGTHTSMLSVIYGLDDFDGKEPNVPSHAEAALDETYKIPKQKTSAKRVAMPYAAVSYGSDAVRIECDPISPAPGPDNAAARSMSSGTVSTGIAAPYGR